MNTTRPDVIEILEKEKKYYADQIRRINVAIAALTGKENVEETKKQEPSSKKSAKSIQWTAEIKRVFDTNDILSVEQTRDRLVENGIVEAMSDSGRNSIYSTFSRLKKSGDLEKVEYGKYRKKQPRRLIRRMDIESNEGSEPSNHSEPSF
ncbi:MAG: hypothetical protein ABII68_09505 [Pseudomonadota bacterium]